MRLLRALLLAGPCVGSAASAQADAWPDARQPVLVLTGENNHDWHWTSTALFSLLETSGKFDVEVSIDPATTLSTPYELERFAAIVLDYNGPRWGADAERAFLEAVRGGTGVVVLHAANNAFEGWSEYEELVGYLWREGTSHGSFHAFDVRMEDAEHPLTRDRADIVAHPDELYHGLVHLHDAQHAVLATAFSDPAYGGSGRREPVLFAGAYGAGRVAHTPLGHVWPGDERSRASYADEAFQRLVVQMVEWAATGEVTPLRRVLPNTLTPADRAAGWKLLFDGRSMAGWSRLGQGLPADRWRVEDGALTVLPGDGDAGDIVAAERYEEFELELEWRMQPDAEGSEFHYRVAPDGTLLWRTALDMRLDAEAGEDVPYDLVPAEGAILRPAGEFNHVRVVARRDRVEHWLNGIEILELAVSAERWAEAVQGENLAQNPALEHVPLGHLVLSGRGQDVSFRNIKIRRPPEEPVAVEAAPRTTELFGDLGSPAWVRYWRVAGETGEAFSKDGEGNLVVTGTPLGYLRTEQAFASYVLDFDWRYHPTTRQTGEGGVLLGVGDVDDIWPYGLELRLEYPTSGDLWAHFGFPFEPDYPRTNDRQTTRLADADRPPGDWNHVSIRVEAGTITVHLNDVLVNRLTGIPDLPGRIGIKSSGTEVHYRKIRVTPLGE